MKLYQIIFSFVEPCQAVATISAETEEEAILKLREQAESQVTDLEIEQVTEIGVVSPEGSVSTVTPADLATPFELPDNVVPFPGTQTRH